jgi:hypothetical protein
MENPAFLDNLVKSASQNAVLMRSKFLNIIKRQINRFHSFRRSFLLDSGIQHG